MRMFLVVPVFVKPLVKLSEKQVLQMFILSCKWSKQERSTLVIFFIVLCITGPGFYRTSCNGINTTLQRNDKIWLCMELCIDTTTAPLCLRFAKKLPLSQAYKQFWGKFFLGHYLNALHHLHYFNTDLLFLITLTLIAILSEISSRILRKREGSVLTLSECPLTLFK